MTDKLRQAAQQALEILECIDSDYWHDFVKGPITDLRAALAEQPAEQQCEYCKRGLKAGICYCKPAEPEPVAWGNFKEDGTLVGLSQHPEDHANWVGRKPLYTTPQPRKRLTDEEIAAALRPCFEWEGQVDEAVLMHIDEYRAIEDAIWSKT